MARFIDAEVFAERLLNAWDTADKEKKSEIVAILSDIVTPILVGTPTSDVAPRAEVEYWKKQCFHACMNNGCLDKAIVDAAVAREIFEEIESEIVAALQSNYRAKQERVEKQLPDDFVSYMCEGKIAALRGIEAFVEELKKKYAEDKPNDN